jgi:hypothetical protein
LNSFAVTAEADEAFQKNSFSLLLSYLESYRQHIVILFLFFAANAIVFMERFWCKCHIWWVVLSVHLGFLPNF